MGDGINTPLTREDVLRKIQENGGTTVGLNLSMHKFVEQIDLSRLNLTGVKLNDARLFRACFNASNLDGSNMQKTYLGYASFCSASLVGADFRGADLHNAEFIGADLSNSQFQEEPQNDVHAARLRNTDFRKAKLVAANFTGCYFYGSKFEGAFIRGADITLPGTHLGEADWGNYKIGEEIGENGKRDYYAAEHRYRHLKMWYTNAGYYDIAAKFYYREKEVSRKAIKWLSRKWYYRLGFEISRWLFRYGESWLWTAGFIITFLLLFTLVYFLLRGVNPFNWTIEAFLNSAYYSAVSFISLGYGPWFQPGSVQGWARALGVCESFVGFFLMTLLLVTFVRKWAR